MVRSGDEPDAMYGLAARSVSISADGLTYRFKLRPQAKFHDGTPLTAHDVVFSLTTLKEKGHPIITQLLRDFKGAEAADDHTVVVRFAEKRGRDVPLFVAGMPIFSRAYYAKQPFDQSTLEIPLGSGAYKVGRFEAGRYIEFNARERLVGRRPAGCARAEQFRHGALRILSRPRRRLRRLHGEELSVPRGVHLAHLGDALRFSRRSRMAASSARCSQDDTPSGAQGWFINTRRKQFKEPRLREALIDAFDFEWTNKNIMYGAYDRTHSVFQNSPMMAQGKPGAAELALLEPFRGQVPDEVFGEPYVPPVTDGSGQDRRWLRAGAQLLEAAGIKLQERQAGAGRTAPKSTIEFLHRRAVVPAAPSALHPQSRHPRHRRDAARRRSGAVPRPPRRFRFRHHGAALQFFLDAGRFAAHLFHLAGGGDQRLAESRRHRRTGGRPRWSTSSSPQSRARNSPPPAARSTASSAPGATGFRIGTRARSGSPIGTSSAGRRSGRAIPAASRKPGGMTPAKAAKLKQKG